MNNQKSLIRKAFSRPAGWIAAVVIVALGGLAFSMLSSSESEVELADEALYTVEEGPLTISVTTSGNIRSSNAKVINNQVEGRTTILWIIPEGTIVEKGDKLMELDSSELEDELVNQELDVETSTANLVTAKENLELARKQGESDIDAEKVNLRLALLDLEKYAGKSIADILGWDNQAYRNNSLTNIAERLQQVDWSQVTLSEGLQAQNQDTSGYAGEYAQQLQQAQNNIDKIDMQLTQAKDQFLGSSNLFHKGYITETEFEGDELSYRTTKLDLTLAKTEKRLLQEFTRRRKLEELMSAVDRQAFLLEKAILQASANVRDAQAKLNAQQENHNREMRRLEETQEQLAACTITAPQAGMVVYGTTGQDRWDDDPPLDEGVEVRERQELFRLPASDEMTADVKIHESMLQKVTEGLPVKITTDALPNQTFQGSIKKVAVMADSQSRWLNPDLKVYNTEVEITGETRGLRPGMSCQAEIIVKEFANTIYVPMQAVLRVDGEPHVYAVGSRGQAEKQRVEVGLDNNRMIRIASGLAPGDQVLLNPPMEEGAKRIGEERKQGEEEPGEGEGLPEERDGGDGRGESITERGTSGSEPQRSEREGDAPQQG